MSRREAAVLAWAVRRARRADHDALCDRDLLARYAESADEAAFAALVSRHSGMVLGVCRRLLPTQQDAEDACQAVFLILARKAKANRWQSSVANWLYATARKVAHNARIASQRRARREGAAAVPEVVAPEDTLSGRELVALLDEELERLSPRYREPLVLCYLEGLTRDEAATRLGVPPATLKGQLERGRKKLGDALTARGCALGVALLATSAARAVSPLLQQSILASAGGSPPAAVAALAQEVAMNSPIKSLALILLAAGLAIAGVGLAARESDKPAIAAGVKAESPPSKVVVVRGTVVGPDGKPVEGAAITTLKQGNFNKPTLQELAKTDKDGRFTAKLDPVPAGRPDLRPIVAAKPGYGPDWINVNELSGEPVALKLVADDVPIRGRVTDLEGNPVPRASVRVRTVSTSPSGDLSKVWEMWPSDPYLALRQAGKELWVPAVAGLNDEIKADEEGRFQLRGFGRGRLVGLEFAADGIETANCRVVVDAKFDPKLLKPAGGRGAMMGPRRVAPDLYGATFTHAGKPSQPVVGAVVDQATGKPIAGIQIMGSVAGPHWGENNVSTKTDAQGRFRLLGVAKAASVSLMVFPGESHHYFAFSTTVTGQPGLTEIPVTIKLRRGVMVKGRITDKGGKPVVGAAVRYTALADNKFYSTHMFDRRSESGMAHTTDIDGRFKLVVLPGVGILLAQGETRGRQAGTEFTQTRIAKEDMPRADLSNLAGLGETFSAADGHIVTLMSLSAYKIIEPKESEESVEVEIVFDRGRTVSGRVVGPDGQPAQGVTAYKLTACYDYPKKLRDGKFTAIALEADHPRTVLFVDAEKKLSAVLKLTGGESELVATMRPWAKLTGRLLDADGKPIAGAKVSPSIVAPAKMMAFQAATQQLSAMTDSEGRFTLEVPSGDVAYTPYYTLKGKYLNAGGRDGHAARPGETTAIGDVKVKAD